MIKKWIPIIAPLLLVGGIAIGLGSDMLQETERKTPSLISSEAGKQISEKIRGSGPQIIEDATPVIQSVTISATGDCALGTLQLHGYEGSFGQYYDKYGEEYFFENVRDIFSADDFTIVNLECVLSYSNDRVEKKFNIRGEPKYTGIMTSSSVEACSLGNNHTMDYGPSSLEDTINALNEAGIVYGYKDYVDTYTTEEGLVIGVVSASLFSYSEQEENYFRDGIADLREKGADIVVACCHWGVEGSHNLTEYQITTAHKIIDWGADVLIGSHPHVLQGMEVYNGKVICYSLGNFSFGANHNPPDFNTLIFQQTFTFINGQLQTDINANIVPCLLSSAKGYNNYQPMVAEEDHWQDIIGKMNSYTKPYSSITFDEDGRLVLPEGE